LGEKASVGSEGQTQWAGFDPAIFEDAIQDMAVILGPDGEQLNSIDCGEIIRHASRLVIKKQGGGKPIPPLVILKQADILAAEFFRKPPARYILISSLSIRSLPTEFIQFKECKISQVKRKKYTLPEIFREESFSPPGYTCIAVRTKGRSIHEAANRAFEALGVVRGLWNLFATFRGWWFGDPRNKPLGEVHSGQFHTMHFPDRKPIEDFYWYDREYQTQYQLFEPTKGWEDLEKNREWAFGKLRRLPYRVELIDILNRYSIAMDHLDHNVSALQLWSILEKITDTIGAKYDQTISRGAWSFSNTRIAREFAHSLRIRRNRYVHLSEAGAKTDRAALLMKSFVDDHLVRLLRNDFKVKTLKEYGKQLDLPRNIETLKARKRRLEDTIQILKKWKSRERKKKYL